jgi:hypothetical protein
MMWAVTPGELTTAGDRFTRWRHDAMMHRMFADLNALMTMRLPDPSQMICSVMQGMPQIGLGSGMLVTSITTGNGTCTQTITYGNGGQPQVKVSSTGDACGAIRPSGPIGVTQPLPAPAPVTPRPVQPRHGRIWNAGYPPHPVTGTPPRT